MKYEQNFSYNRGGVVYVLKVRHLDQHDSRYTTSKMKIINFSLVLVNYSKFGILK